MQSPDAKFFLAKIKLAKNTMKNLFTRLTPKGKRFRLVQTINYVQYRGSELYALTLECWVFTAGRLQVSESASVCAVGP